MVFIAGDLMQPDRRFSSSGGCLGKAKGPARCAPAERGTVQRNPCVPKYCMYGLVQAWVEQNVTSQTCAAATQHVMYACIVVLNAHTCDCVWGGG